MRIDRLQIEHFRLFEKIELSLDPGLNLLLGGNGAGKTSVLEAVYVLAYGRSFRGAVREGLIRRGQTALRVFAEVSDVAGQNHRLGVERGLREWQARIDGQSVPGLSEIYRQIAVVCFEPGSHALIAGGSEHRRRFMDWALFHVEPNFLPIWRRCQRALKQRNALLKSGASDATGLEAFEFELADAGERLTALRESYLLRLAPGLSDTANHFLPELGELSLRYQRGWPRESGALSEALRASRTRDSLLGHTTVGPHRADWTLGYAQLPSRDTFSRGQEKLTALACVLAQAESFAAERGQWPILCLDDLASELDRAHLALALKRLSTVPAQVLLTGTEAPAELSAWKGPLARFHVEQGRIERLL